MLQLLTLALTLVVVLSVAAVAAGQAAARGRQPWIPLTVVWLATGLPQYLVRPELTGPSVVAAVWLLAPLGVTVLATDLEVRRGCSLRRAGGVAVLLGASVAAATPFLISHISRLLCAATDYL
jgi:hypothetical protein